MIPLSCRSNLVGRLVTHHVWKIFTQILIGDIVMIITLVHEHFYFQVSSTSPSISCVGWTLFTVICLHIFVKYLMYSVTCCTLADMFVG